MVHVLLGIGNELKGDDGIGNVMARQFRHPGWLSVPCETVPENFTAVVKRQRPELLVIVDAADMGLEPGELRLVGKEMLGSAGFGTHGMPLRHLVSHLGRHAGRVLFIGIQPGNVELGGKVSRGVERGKDMLIDIVKKEDWDSIKTLR
jgi:hydrogenase 3 maturation protease